MGHPMIRPSPLLTSELLFMAEAGNLSGDPGGPMFRAYDKSTGDVLAEIELPIKASGAPMSYFHEGHQYIVIAVATAEQPAELVALALPGARARAVDVAYQPINPLSAQLSAPYGAGASPEMPSDGLSAQQIEVVEKLFSDNCARCHGVNGQGAVGVFAPALTGALTGSQISRVISQGGVEMPSFEARLTSDDIALLTSFILGGFSPE
jgi:quinoprotein glucose dehydrogenase